MNEEDIMFKNRVSKKLSLALLVSLIVVLSNLFSSFQITAHPLLAPPAPTNLAAVGTIDEIWFSVTPVSGADYYKLYRAKSLYGSKQFITNVTSTAFFKDTTASIGEFYCYWLTAVDGSGESGYSNHATAYLHDSNIPAPTNVQATDGTYSDKVRVTWNSVSGATAYRVDRATSLTGERQLSTFVSGTSYDDPNVTLGTTYYYWVCIASDGIGEKPHQS
ncbi:hypothetical protein [Neptuniibacter sp.]|uniref:fibronectin type III domain-containing protein n=1 Tax=Neptuniibacter sp. TaxID=1962643 RepID=UPI00261B18CC|nr:hypothetical protein [Neptuniibacter sp.]MCP4595271.1 hypothetical protein [Neptuniibacter sp.]